MRLILTLATALLVLSPAGVVMADPLGAPEPPTAVEITVYATTRHMDAAWTVSQHTGTDYSDVLAAWSDDRQVGLDALFAALDNLGANYRYASRGPSFDCSGLTGYAWATQGVEIGNNSSSQHNATSSSEVTAGALVFRPGHIAMSLGIGDWIIHAANRSTGVVISRMNGSVTYPNV